MTSILIVYFGTMLALALTTYVAPAHVARVTLLLWGVLALLGCAAVALAAFLALALLVVCSGALAVMSADVHRHDSRHVVDD